MTIAFDTPQYVPAANDAQDTAAVAELERLRHENILLRSRLENKTTYIRDKINCLLEIMGTMPLKEEELDENHLVAMDPLGIIFESLRHVMANLKQTNSQLHMFNEETSAIFAAVDVGIMVVDRNMRMLSCNAKMKELFPQKAASFIPGVSCCLDAICQGTVEEEFCTVKRVLAGEEIARLRNWYFGGRYFDVSATPIRDEDGAVNNVVVVYSDVTSLKQAEEERINLERQLLHAQKLESLGILAGGIAHDFNNILAAIVGNADLALMRLDRQSPAHGNLLKIEQAATRAADLAKQMLAYSGKGKFMVESLDMNRLLTEMLHILEVSISKKAALHLNLCNIPPVVEADATQLRQIIMNLVINASEALGEQNGEITITTGQIQLDMDSSWLDKGIKAGNYVFLEITDNGCGMDQETREKIFEPFFSTKFTGRGLGLAAVMGIIRGHHGAIQVQSEPGAGSSFRVMLPAVEKAVASQKEEQGQAACTGAGTVLLVDDEECVRAIGREMLEILGFRVITANDGNEALAAFRANPAIAGVILDLTMPNMDGEQCLRELRQLDPQLKVIISSGYSRHEITARFAGHELAGFIQKPYTLTTLGEAVKTLV